MTKNVGIICEVYKYDFCRQLSPNNPPSIFIDYNIDCQLTQSSYLFKSMAFQDKPNLVGNVKVVCRFRPLNQKEKVMGAIHVHELLDDKTTAIKDRQVKDSKESLKFNFDKVFDVNSSQKDVYQYAASSVIESVLEGFNGTIFAYGQTASGKTHTMEGEISPILNENSGIIPRMVKHVFDSITTSSENIEFRIKVSLVELYMEKLRDLLDQNKLDLKIRSDKKKGIFIEDLSEKYISSPEEVYELIEKARNSRAIASTNMNQRSSRSHMIFLLTISQNNVDDLSAKTGKLYLVDLAGSQKISKTGAQGQTLDQAKKINASLTTLGKVINSLTDGKSTHIPYRDSKLTRVLQESLGGNSKTTLIVTCSPHPNNISETISTLRFGISAKKIKNKPKINKEMTVAELQNLLEKAEKEVIERDKYIGQLKNYILCDLKQKSVPQFESEKTLPTLENEENDIMNELERQLEMQRNLHLVQQQQINSLKLKCDQITVEKDDLEKEIQILKKDMICKQVQKQIIPTEEAPITVGQIMKELENITSDEKVLNFISSKSKLHMSSQEEHNKLLEDYEQEKEKRRKADQQMVKYEKNMQKKLMQLENNICQLTHAYYDLVVVQQRYKVDNIFLKKNLQEKDVFILSLKEKIKDLEDQNRELQDQNIGLADQEGEDEEVTKNIVKMKSSEHLNKMDDLTDKKNPHSKVVKVLKGGLK